MRRCAGVPGPACMKEQWQAWGTTCAKEPCNLQPCNQSTPPGNGKRPHCAYLQQPWNGHVHELVIQPIVIKPLHVLPRDGNTQPLVSDQNFLQIEVQVCAQLAPPPTCPAKVQKNALWSMTTHACLANTHIEWLVLVSGCLPGTLLSLFTAGGQTVAHALWWVQAMLDRLKCGSTVRHTNIEAQVGTLMHPRLLTRQTHWTTTCPLSI